MIPGFGDRLQAAIQATRSATVVGIDPVVERMPPDLARAMADPNQYTPTLRAFGEGIIDAVADLVPAVKPNIAFFEAYGLSGLMAYIHICAHARDKGLLVIGDIKRGDIGSTAAAYAKAHLQPAPPEHLGQPALANPFQFGPHDAVTLNPYLGSDGLQPFLDAMDAHGMGCFILVKTSNPSSSEIQDKHLADGGTLAQHVAGLVARWGEDRRGESGMSCVGAVVGATHGEELDQFRAAMPDTPLLLPGYGAQGGGATDVVGGFRADGGGAVVNASRSIIYAWQREEKPEDWQGSARRAAECMNAEILAALRSAGKDALFSPAPSA